MATGFEAIETLARETGMPFFLVARVARILKETGQDRWPMGGKGGGRLKGRHVLPHHLVNLLIALAVAEPYTAAPDIVRLYRGLVPGNGAILPGSTLGETLDEMVFTVATDASRYIGIDLEIALEAGRSSAVVSMKAGDGHACETLYGSAKPELPGFAEPICAVRAIRHVSIIPFELISVLAGIARDSLRRSQQDAPAAPTSAGPRDQSRLSNGLRRSASAGQFARIRNKWTQKRFLEARRRMRRVDFYL